MSSSFYIMTIFDTSKDSSCSEGKRKNVHVVLQMGTVPLKNRMYKMGNGESRRRAVQNLIATVL